MTMPIRLKGRDFDFLQTDYEHVDGCDVLADFDRDDDAVTRPLRAWISPDTARRIALIARAHDVSSTVIMGAMLHRGVRNWPGQFQAIEDDSGDVDPAQLVIEFDPNGGQV